MRLAGLADAVLSEPVLAAAMARAGDLDARAFDLTGPAALRPFAIAGLARTGRTVLVVTATVRERPWWSSSPRWCPPTDWCTSRRGRRCRTSG